MEQKGDFLRANIRVMRKLYGAKIVNGGCDYKERIPFIKVKKGENMYILIPRHKDGETYIDAVNLENKKKLEEILEEIEK